MNVAGGSKMLQAKAMTMLGMEFLLTKKLLIKICVWSWSNSILPRMNFCT